MFTNYDGSISWIEVLIAMIIVSIFSAFFLVIYDVGYLEYKTFDARIACEQKRMISHRNNFSKNVICTPPIVRNDSLTIVR